MNRKDLRILAILLLLAAVAGPVAKHFVELWKERQAAPAATNETPSTGTVTP